MSGGLVGGVIGAVIGFAFGNPQIGWMVGSSIGGMFSSKKQGGPDMTDLRPQTSEYGRPIPIIYSVMAVGGNIIWASDLVKTSDGDDGGKGGGGRPTGPTYAANFAVLICESPGGVMSLGKIWAGPEKRLIYDPAGGTFESGALHFYNGAEDQMPDAVMESYMGAGQVPAYRGYAYVVVEMFDVSQHDGNRIPFLTIEVGREGQATAPTLGQFFVDGLFMGSASIVATYWGSYFGSLQHSPTMVFMHRREEALSEFGGPGTTNLWDDPRDTVVRVVGGLGVTTNWMTTQVMSTGAYARRTPFTAAGDEAIVGAALNAGNRVVIACQITTGGVRFHFVDPNTWLEVGTPQEFDIGSTETLNRIYSYGYDQGGVFGVTTAGRARYYPLGGGASSTDCGAAANFATTLSGGVDPVTQFFWTVKLVGGVLTWSVHNAGGLVYSGTDALTTFDDISRQPLTFAPDGVYVIGERWLAIDHFAKMDKNTGEQLSTFDTSYHGVSELHAVVWNPITSRFVGYREGGTYDITTTSSLTTMPASFQSLNGQDASLQAMSLAAVVTDLSLRAGLTAADIDVTQLTDMVDGYTIANQVSVKDAIATLMPMYYFDAVEDQGVLRFIKRGGAIAAEIPDDDLGAQASGEDSPDLYETTRAMDEELPHTLSVTYVLANTKYSPATKPARRLIGYSGDEARIEVPMVFTDAKAMEIAQVNLHDQWVSRISYKVSLGRKYSYLMATDVIGVQGYTLRLTKETTSDNGVRVFEAVRDDGDTYTPNVIVEETPPSDEGVSTQSLTLLELM